MPPRKQKQAVSASASVASNDNIPAFPAPPTLALAKTEDEQTHTPERSPEKRSAMTITEAQKQALMDNLQLEITERARKLRAQYALQAQGLRARLEMRVNRIPQALRKRNMQDLLDEQADAAKPKPAAPLQIQDAHSRGAMRTSLKRTSEHFGSNKENADTSSDYENLANPKKRTKTAPSAAAKSTHGASRKDVNSEVLSPKSHNSRARPASPLKTAVSGKMSSFNSRPASPAKSTFHSTFSSDPPSSRPPSRQPKRPGTALSAAMASENGDSEISTASAGTTIVTKAGAKKASTSRKAPVPKVSTATTKRTAAVKKEPTPAAGGRTLRKRA